MTDLLYQLDIDLPAPWRSINMGELEEGRERLGGLSILQNLPSILAEPPGPPDYMASLVLPLQPQTRKGVVAILSIGLLVKVVSTHGTPVPLDTEAFSIRVLKAVPITEDLSAPVLTQTLPVNSDDGRAVALVTFSTPNVALREELEPTFPVVASKVALRCIDPNRKSTPALPEGAHL